MCFLHGERTLSKAHCLSEVQQTLPLSQWDLGAEETEETTVSTGGRAQREPPHCLERDEGTVIADIMTQIVITGKPYHKCLFNQVHMTKMCHDYNFTVAIQRTSVPFYQTVVGGNASFTPCDKYIRAG